MTSKTKPFHNGRGVSTLKLKAVLDPDTPAELVDYLNSRKFAAEILNEVLNPHLHVPSPWRGADFYVQNCDFGVGGNPSLFCEVRLTGVSANDDRSKTDFRKALGGLEQAYMRAIHRLIPRGIKVQLMVCLMLDKPIAFDNKEPLSLLETQPVEVEGEADPIT